MKETKIEKLILDLSNRWDCSPQEAVDRLNSMNESEINKLINSMTNKFKNGGFINCLRAGGTVSKCKCGCDKIAKAEGGKKIKRTDTSGYAYTLSNGIDVLTQDAAGPQPLPGSYYPIDGSYPEMETRRTTLTNKGGDPISYNYDVYVNDGDHFFPSHRYTTQKLWYRPSTWLRTELTPEAAAEKQKAYDVNNLQMGGSFKNKRDLYRTAASIAPDLLGTQDVEDGYNVYMNMGRDNGLRGRALRSYARNNTVRDINNLANTKDWQAMRNSGIGVDKSWADSNRNMFDVAMGNGYTRSQTNLAYQNQKNVLRNQGLRGSDLRQTARENVVNLLANAKPKTT